MKHECAKNSGIEREMSLCYVCSCGEQVGVEEFTEEEIECLRSIATEKLIAFNESISRIGEHCFSSAYIHAGRSILESIIEKVRKM